MDKKEDIKLGISILERVLVSSKVRKDIEGELWDRLDKKKAELRKLEKEEKESGYTQEELKNLIATLRGLQAKGNEFAGKQANVLSFLIK